VLRGQRLLLGGRGGAVGGVREPQLPRHGRPVPAALVGGGRGRRVRDLGRARLLPRHARRRVHPRHGEHDAVGDDAARGCEADRLRRRDPRRRPGDASEGMSPQTRREAVMAATDQTRGFTLKGREDEVGPAGDLGPADVLAALGSVKEGRIYDLEVERFRGMPLHPAHPQIEIVSYRSPRGIRNQGDQAWLNEDNAAKLAFNSELVLGTVHSGTHIDALAHITVGDDDHWYGGFSANEHLGDWGALKGDATAIPPIISRGVLIDVAGHMGVEVLAGSKGISSADLKDALAAQGVELRPGDSVLIRTGYGSLYPDAERMKAHFG